MFSGKLEILLMFADRMGGTKALRYPSSELAFEVDRYFFARITLVVFADITGFSF
jgi:hypothetical protein